MKALLLAAGLGTRFRPHTLEVTKPAIEFLNIPILCYSVGLLRAGSGDGLVSEFVVNAHYKPSQVEALIPRIKHALSGRVSLQMSHEREAPMGSAGAIFHARELLDGEEEFFLANGDEIIWPKHMRLVDAMTEQHRASGALATILVKRDPRVGTQFGGIWADPTRKVHGFGKTALAGLEGFHYTGVILINRRIFKFSRPGESNIFYDVLKDAIAAGERVEIFYDDSRWYETGNLQDFLSASREALDEVIAQGGPVRSRDPYLRHLFDLFQPGELRGRHLVASHVQLDPKAELQGTVILGSGSRVPAGCVLKNVVVREGLALAPKKYENDLVLKA